MGGYMAYAVYSDKYEVIQINNRKSKLTVPYSIHNSVIREVKAAKYLGVTI